MIVPAENQKDLPDIPEYIRTVLKLHFVEHMDEVLHIALERDLVALPMTPTTVDVVPLAEADRAHQCGGSTLLDATTWVAS